MAFLTELWLPILLSAVFVFIASSVLHMVLPIHKNDCKQMANEDAVLEALRSGGVQTGNYTFPWAASMKEMGSPEMMAKVKSGPCGFLTVLPPGGWNLGTSLISWFVFSLVIGTLVAYLSWHALGAGAAYLDVFRITGMAAILVYAVGHCHDSIWKGVNWGTTGKFAFDGVVYGLVTAGTFGWLWPGAAA
jgi:hypothetical protein